jgi:hypothetical protein
MGCSLSPSGRIAFSSLPGRSGTGGLPRNRRGRHFHAAHLLGFWPAGCRNCPVLS